jgi:UPF0755 protein
MKIFGTALLLIAALAVGREALYFFTPNSPDDAYKIILIEPGSFYKNAENLFQQGIIHDPRRFARIVRVLGFGSKVKIGEYEVRLNMSPYQILKVLMSGKSVLHPVHVPEGYNIEQVADDLASKKLVDRKEFLSLALDSHMAKYLKVDDVSLEGYLFPDTYSFTHYTGDRVILKTMVDKFREVYDREIKADAEKANMSMHEVVTLASIIEKETGAPEERPLISSVFHNRLRMKMKLQSDPTVIYGKKGDKKNITRKDLLTPTPYNTYTLPGLPLGPIANPGRESLLAAVHPATTTYLYFVSQNNGTHVFTSNYKDHQKAVAKFQLDPAAREGHSWRERLKTSQQQNQAH